MKQIEFEHTIYEKRGYVSGAYPPETNSHSQKIGRLAKDADAALHQQNGYFFETLEMHQPMFAFGFLIVEKENRSEPFFDIYLAPIQQVSGTSLVDIKQQLEQNSERISNRHDPIVETVTVEAKRVTLIDEQNSNINLSHTNKRDTERIQEDPSTYDPNSQPEQVDHESGVSSTSQPSSSIPEEPVDPSGFDETNQREVGRGTTEAEMQISPMSIQKVAEMWEQYRRMGMRTPATLEDLNQFVATVSGSVSEINYVSRSPDRGDPNRFKFVGGYQNNQSGFNTSDLTHWLEQQYTPQELSWNDLPTYDDELHQLQKFKKENLQKSVTYDDVSDEVSVWLQRQIQTEITQYHQRQVVKIFEQTLSGSYETSEETGKLTGLRGLMSSNKTEDQYDTLIDSIESEEINKETKEAIIKKLGRETHTELSDRIESKIIKKLNQHLQNEVEKKVKQILTQTIDDVNTIKSSVAYREAEQNK